MSNSSLTGGYLKPNQTTSLPQGLSLTQFIQTVLVGISGISGTLVRPTWQQEPPKSAGIDANWIAFGLTEQAPDANLFTQTDLDGVTHTQRQYGLEVNCSIYGPDALDLASLITDGFQIQQNLDALKKANMGFVECSRASHQPDLLNQRWVNRIVMNIFLRRQINRTYPISSFIGANGTIHTVVGNEEYLVPFNTNNERT